MGKAPGLDSGVQVRASGSKSVGDPAPCDVNQRIFLGHRREAAGAAIQHVALPVCNHIPQRRHTAGIPNATTAAATTTTTISTSTTTSTTAHQRPAFIGSRKESRKARTPESSESAGYGLMVSG